MQSTPLPWPLSPPDYRLRRPRQGRVLPIPCRGGRRIPLATRSRHPSQTRRPLVAGCEPVLKGGEQYCRLRNIMATHGTVRYTGPDTIEALTADREKMWQVSPPPPPARSSSWSCYWSVWRFSCCSANPPVSDRREAWSRSGHDSASESDASKHAAAYRPSPMGDTDLPLTCCPRDGMSTRRAAGPASAVLPWRAGGVVNAFGHASRGKADLWRTRAEMLSALPGTSSDGAGRSRRSRASLASELSRTTPR